VIRSPRRRLTAIAVMGALAVVALAGCRTDAGSAAYVGNTRITTDKVNEIIDSAPHLSADQSGPRKEVVNDLVYRAAVQKYAAANKIKLTAVDDALRAQYAQAYQVPNDAAHRPFIDLEAQIATWTQDLLKAQPATAPSDAELMRLFNELKLGEQGYVFDQVKPQLLQIPNVAQGLTLRTSMESAFKGYDISISPMYTPDCTKAPCPAPSVPLVTIQDPNSGAPLTVITMPLTPGEASPGVLDLPSAPPTAPAQS
jgi:hypothetical protein